MRLHFPSASALRLMVGVALIVITPLILTGCGSSAFSSPPTTKVALATALAANPSSTTSAASPSSATSNSASGSSTVPVLLFNGTGTCSSCVSAVESLLNSLNLKYSTANTSQLNSMSETQLKTFKLLIVPGGNALTIAAHLTKTATTNVRNAVNTGLHYLGICAGAFFAGSDYNELNLTGTWFNLYSSNTSKQVVDVQFPNGTVLDIYEQDGPELSGWGSVVGKYSDGKPAMAEGKFGTGWVILSGVHPEAPASWRYGMNFTTPLSTDLALAGQLVTNALNGTSMPHF